MSEEFVLAERLSVSLEEAKRWLIDEYPPQTVEFYDFGGRQEPEFVFDRGLYGIYSPPNRVTLEDLGRISIIDAQLRGWGAVGLLEASDRADWNKVPRDCRLDSPEMEFGTVTYEHAEALWNAFLAETHRKAWVSKLLHLKRPLLYPIIDSRVVRLYRGAAKKQAQVHGVPGALYWMAIRQDLMTENARAFENLRGLLLKEPVDHAQRLAKLPSLRLLDMLSWGVEFEPGRSRRASKPTRRLKSSRL